MKMKFIVCMSAIFCCLLFAGTVSKASQVQPTVTPGPDQVLLTPKLVKSGIYTYQVTNEKEKKIALRHVDTAGEKLVIPAYIDGYQVDTVGLPFIWPDDYELRALYREESFPVILSGKENLKELTIPEGVSYLGESSFEGCINLSKLNLPSNPIEIGIEAFGECKSLVRFVFRNKTKLYEAALYGWDTIEEIVLLSSLDDDDESPAFAGKNLIKRIYIPKNAASYVDLWVFRYVNCINEIKVDGKLKGLAFSRPFIRKGMTVDKLIVNYKGTKLEYWDDLSSANTTKITFNSIFTVSGAKAISFAKARKATHYVKKTGKTQVVKGKKAKKGYKASWKKVKTTITTNKYKTAKKKWSKSTKAVKTVYQVYGKKTKTGKYQFIKTTKSKKLVSKYKYVKVVPKQTW